MNNIITQSFGWEVSRAAAWVALVAYTASLVWGFSLAGRWAAFRPAGASVEYHRWMSSIGLFAVFVHGIFMLFDKYAKVDVADIFFVGSEFELATGMLAAWLMVLLPFSIFLKKRKLITPKTWRKFHYTAWIVWPLIIIHGVKMGTDQSWWAISLYLICTLAVVTSAGLRLYKRRPGLKKDKNVGEVL